MSSNQNMDIVLVIDTNVLHEKADNGCNFCEFKFNKLFQNIVDEIEKRDLIENVEIGIPEVVWKELFYQRLTNYNSKKNELKKITDKFIFPNFQFEMNELCYETYLKDKVNVFKDRLSNYQTNIVQIDLPSNNRFDSIIQRAFRKNPPFEGKDKNSDKGFKDALIWESILEFKNLNKNKNILLYSRDGLFNELLEEEYRKCFDDSIIILKNEESVIKYLTNIQKSIEYMRVSEDDNIEYYKKIKDILDNIAISELICSLEITHTIGSYVFDLSDIKSIDIKDINDITKDSNMSGLNFEAIIEANITFSNVDKNEDIELEREEIIFYIDYIFQDDIYYLKNIEVMKNEYDLELAGIEGEVHV